ncbi:hypothetical protein [Marinomonas ostreistagni]|uniref:Uncharacterized protein n=1 Tax=Marinomonas ostreistagni TaxID=359209 RepID=A0ABS0ZAP5_9GAMM|nr:hypothetical protein [Marinomonas ostreistagni]MBJ7550725.1 hypothetical protein [Marinomonas ostreistagni]
MSFRKESVGIFYTENTGQPVQVIAWIKQITHRSNFGVRTLDGTVDYKTSTSDELNPSGPFVRGEHPKEFEYLYSAADGSKKLLSEPPTT